MKLTCRVFFLTLFFPVLLNAQEAGLLRLKADRPAQEGEAAVWGGVEEGRFKTTSDAVFQWSAGADAKIARHGKTTSFSGALSFEQMMGTGMSGSMMLEPGYYPIDLLETGRGTKSRQTGRLEAAILTDLGQEWAAGLKASAKVMNSTKNQDVRHSAFGVDVQLEPTLTYVMDDDMGFISSYFFRYRTEQVKARDGETVLFLDKGMRYGKMVEGLSVFPVQEQAHGFNELFYSPDISVGFGMAWKRGTAGEKDYGRHWFPEHVLNASLEYTYQADNADHVFRFSYGRVHGKLKEADTNDLLYDRKKRTPGFKYEARLLNSTLKGIGLELEVNRWTERAWTPLLYDSYLGYNGAATLFSSFGFGPVDVSLNVLGAGGFIIRDPESDREKPENMHDDWLRNIEYRTTPRVGMGGTLTYHISSSLYVQLYGYWHRAFSVTYLGGKNREIGTLKVGYKF